MNKFYRRSLSVVFLGLLVQAPVNAEINDDIGHNIDQSSANHAAMGANHPPINHMGNMGQMGKGTMPANMPMMPEGPKKQGKVVEIISGAGYSYLLLESDGKKFWIAGTQVSAKAGDAVRYIENVTMSNFTSKTLNRTFDQIVFASDVAVAN